MDSKIYFKEVAKEWDNMRQDFFSESVRDKAYEVADVKEGKLAADIGAGTGFITEGLLKKGLNVIAVDQSNEMLQEMKQKFNQYNQVEYRQGDAESLPINNDTVDYAMANMYLHHVENPLSAIKEMVRILKPSGKLVITDLDNHNHEFLRTEHHDRWMGFDRKDIENWFVEAGLSNVFVDCVGGSCNATSSCGCESASISIFVAYGEK
ncbi:class I SAM-dependent methyltransferase [Clostridium sp. C8-1-8]|uniref:class I SAM-dependent methyltransferase n=1 Tax=Clostridium sp. C8-1-8 TaxID=2698831 RepID=UPI001368864E|nr:class I SAM-dependent methyltransferase [Clostridium sp. C8-1-8]